MSSNNGVRRMEEPYAEKDGESRKEFNTWLSKKIMVVTTDSDVTVGLDKTIQ